MSLPEADDLEMLRETATLFAALFEHSGAGVAVVETATGRIVRANPALCELLGRTSDELRAVDVESHWQMTNHWLPFSERLLSNGGHAQQ